MPAGAALTATAVAVVVVVAYGPGSDRPAVAATAPMLSYRTAGAPPVGSLLPALAARAGRQTPLAPPAGGYAFQVTESWNLVVSVSGSAVTSQVTPRLEKVWSTGAGRAVRETDQDGAAVTPGPLSRAEEAAARRETASGPVTSETESSPQVRLPVTPAALFRRLADSVGPRLSSQVDVGRALENLTGYLRSSPPSPRLLATVYRMVALFPGTADAGWVTDRAGRRGLALSVPVGGPGYEHSIRLIVAPRSGRLLDYEDIQIDSSAVKIRTPFVFSYLLFLRSGTAHALRRP